MRDNPCDGLKGVTRRDAGVPEMRDNPRDGLKGVTRRDARVFRISGGTRNAGYPRVTD